MTLSLTKNLYNKNLNKAKKLETLKMMMIYFINSYITNFLMMINKMIKLQTKYKKNKIKKNNNYYNNKRKIFIIHKNKMNFKLEKRFNTKVTKKKQKHYRTL